MSTINRQKEHRLRLNIRTYADMPQPFETHILAEGSFDFCDGYRGCVTDYLNVIFSELKDKSRLELHLEKTK